MLALVDAELLEPQHEAACEEVRVARLVLGEDDHADPDGLPVAQSPKGRAPGLPGRSPHRAGDRLSLRGRSAAEEGERDVQVIAREDADAVRARDLPLLPGDEALDGGLGEAKGDEEPKALIAGNASPLSHASL